MRTPFRRLKKYASTAWILVRFSCRWGYIRAVRWLCPSRRPDSPCKAFRKPGAIACYRLIHDSESFTFDHHELVRVVNPKAGEFYVLTVSTLQKRTSWHLSYHKSGAFHRREGNGAKVEPRDGEADERRAFLIQQAMWHLTDRLDGYCLAVGRRVSIEALQKMLEILDGYVLPPLSIAVNAAPLLDRQNQILPMLDSPEKAEAERIIDQAMQSGEYSTISPEEMEALVHSTLGNQCKVVLLKPKPVNYLAYSKEISVRLIDLARGLAAQKMHAKPDGFWTGDQ